MDPMEIVALINAAISVTTNAVSLYNSVKNTMSEEDQAKVHAALEDVIVVTAGLRAEVDAALENASKTS